MEAEVNTEAPTIDASSDNDFYAALQDYADLRAKLEKVSKVKNDLEKAIENMAQALVPVFEARRLKSIRLAGVGLISTAANNNPKVVDTDKLFAWLESQGEDGIIKRQVNYMTLKGFLNRRADDGLALPPEDVCELTSGRILKLTREKGN
jgi:hypothetical protein